MRVRRCKQSVIPREKRARGRPELPAGEAVHKRIRVSGKLMNKVLVKTRPGETYNDTILRMLDELE